MLFKYTLFYPHLPQSACKNYTFTKKVAVFFPQSCYKMV